jgi:transposase
MIRTEEFIVIHTLYKQGHSIRSISKIIKIDRRTISKRLKEEELKPYKERKYPSKVDDYKGYIHARLMQALPKKIPSTVILDEILSRGYEGKIRILQAHMKSWYEEHTGAIEAQEVERFETKPGFQAQVDWTTIRKGKNPIYGFVMILGYSRAPFVYFTDTMKQSEWQACHERAFAYFQGTAQTILYDNLKSAIIQRDKYGKGRHGFNQAFLDFSKGSFVPKFCQPNRPQTKGKVERFNRYLKENFFIPLKASLKGSGIEITHSLLNTHIFSWIEKSNERIHATTKEKPAKRLMKERRYLTPYLPKVVKPLVCLEEKVATPTIPKMDIDYFTTLSDYERILLQGGTYAS